ncbi:MAG TPA: ABC transporter permease, partial [Pedococcus sp.]|nr:ABC transporter permease [Pedococcus sp.]
FVLPQFLLCGLLVARGSLPDVLRWVSDVLPLSYAVDAMKAVTASATPGSDVAGDAAVIALWVVVSLALGSLTLRRRTA